MAQKQGRGRAPVAPKQDRGRAEAALKQARGRTEGQCLRCTGACPRRQQGQPARPWVRRQERPLEQCPPRAQQSSSAGTRTGLLGGVGLVESWILSTGLLNPAESWISSTGLLGPAVAAAWLKGLAQGGGEHSSCPEEGPAKSCSEEGPGREQLRALWALRMTSWWPKTIFIFDSFVKW